MILYQLEQSYCLGILLEIVFQSCTFIRPSFPVFSCLEWSKKHGPNTWINCTFPLAVCMPSSTFKAAKQNWIRLDVPFNSFSQYHGSRVTRGTRNTVQVN